MLIIINYQLTAKTDNVASATITDTNNFTNFIGNISEIDRFSGLYFALEMNTVSLQQNYIIIWVAPLLIKQ